MKKMARTITIAGAPHKAFVGDAAVMREIDENGGQRVTRTLQTDVLQSDFASPPLAGTKGEIDGVQYRIPSGVEAESVGSIYRITWEAI